MRVTIAISAVLAAAAAGAQEGPSAAARSGPMTVTYRSQTAVYVSAGRSARLAVGDRLAVQSGAEKLAELEVVFLAEHSSSCRVVAETRPVKPGDKLVRLGPPRVAAPPEAPPEIAVTPSPTAAAVAYGSGLTTRRDQDRWARLTGGASIAAGGFQDSSGSGRNVQEQGGRADVAAREILGLPLEARVRVSGRRVQRDGLRGTQALKAVDSRRRLYEASMAWGPPDAPFSAAIGRLGGGHFPGMGYLDGIVGRARPLDGVDVGGFFGRTPDPLDVGLPSGAKYGAFVRFSSQSRRSPAELVVSAAREMAGNEASREFVGQEAQMRTSTVWLYERMEVDLNRGWRLERAGRAFDVSEARALMTWRASHEADLTVSYDRSRNYWSALNRGLSSDAFDRRLRQSLRADLQISRPGGMGFWFGGSARAEEGTEELSYAGHAGLRSPRFASLSLSVEGSYFLSPSTRGAILTARAGRSLGGGHRVDFSYTANRYQTGGDWNMSQWLRASAYAQGFGRAFGRLDLEYAVQDPLPGVRALAEVGLRF